MNIEQAVAVTNLKKQSMSFTFEGQETKTAKAIAELVFDLSAAAGEPYKNAMPLTWAKRWLGSKKFVLVDINPRQVAVPFVNRISRNKVLETMQASAESLPPIVVDVNIQKIGKTGTGYIPSLIVVDGKHRHRAHMLCGRERITAWVGERALLELKARAATRKTFVVEKPNGTKAYMSPIEVQAALSTAVPARMDVGDGGSRPFGPPHTPVGGRPPVGGAPIRPVGTGGGMPTRPVAGPVSIKRLASGGPGSGPHSESGWRIHPAKEDEAALNKMDPRLREGTKYGKTSAEKSLADKKGWEESQILDAGGASTGAGPGSATSGLNPARTGIYSEVDPSDRGQMLDPSDKEQFSNGNAKGGSPRNQSPGSGVGPRVRPSPGSSKGDMAKILKAGPITVKKIVTDKKRRMQAVAPPGREKQVLKLKEKYGEDSDVPFKIAWSQENKGK